MKRMLDLLYAGDLIRAYTALPLHCFSKYMRKNESLALMYADDLATMLLLIAVAEGFEL